MPEIGKVLSVNRREIIQRIYMLLTSGTVTSSLALPDPSQLCRGVIACSVNGNVPTSGYARLGDT